MSANSSQDGRSGDRVELRRELGVWDGTLLTVGGVIGTGIFLVSGDIAKALPHGGLLLAVWLLGGLLTLAGALTYAELGAMYPHAGGMYHFLKEAYGPLPGFLFGWACFLVIMSGGIAAIAIGFGEYLGAFWSFSSRTNVFASAEIGGWTWQLTGVQLVGVAAILFLTAVNHFGLKQGAIVQNLLTVLKIGAIVAVGVFGMAVAARSAIGIQAPMPPAEAFAGGSLLAAAGIAMIAVLWTFDGWYGLTFSAGEMKNPGRSLPLGLIGGTAIIVALYLLLNVVYLRAMPVTDIAGQPRIAEAAVSVLFGPAAGRWLAGAVALSSFGCVAATILYSSRIYQPMAADGLFFRALAKVDPVKQVPIASLWAQSLWAVLLTLSGTYSQLYTYVIFASLLFHFATGASVFVLRRKQPHVERPYRTWGYPVVPLLFLGATAVLLFNTLFEQPVESGAGLVLLAIGLPVYAAFRKRSASGR